MVSKDLIRLLENFDDPSLELLAGIAARMAQVKAERWTGSVAFTLNATQGAFADMHINKGEVLRVKRQRVARSSGI